VERREHGRHDDLDLRVAVEPVQHRARELDRLGDREVQLPVARDERDAAAFHPRRASTPGSLRPSSSSSEAPPPVDTCPKRSASPARWTAATLSPPPTTLVPGEAATACATPRVPFANAS